MRSKLLCGVGGGYRWSAAENVRFPLYITLTLREFSMENSHVYFNVCRGAAALGY
jgi:hypothetical protein